MHIKYYGSDISGGLPSTFALQFTNPYANIPRNSPSYCVWMVPGTFDKNGYPIDG